ncbi:MAG TPA: LytTR family DNA-binding domain-containing protein [Kofleriaceae bacterium]|nr:LytTR family DNA-binding domain-containing protein [Kofleriaceae bacterium]
MRALVVDDEAPARAKLVRFLDDDGRFELAGEAADGIAAVAQIEALRPDLLLLDIQMPGLTGFEVLHAVGPAACPKVVFSTAYDRYALEAFNAHAVDYLLKPYDFRRFRIAVDRAYAQLGAGRADAAVLEALLARYPGAHGRYLERIVVKREDGWIPIPLGRVRRLSAEGKYVRVCETGGEQLIRDSLGELEARLDPAKFVRVHRGEIVALWAVARFDGTLHGDALIELDDKSSVVVSRTYRDVFMARWRGR